VPFHRCGDIRRFTDDIHLFPCRFQAVDGLLHCARGLGTGATKKRVFDRMAFEKLFISAAGLTFTELVDFAVGEGLIKFVRSPESAEPYLVLIHEDD
jgi:hypothetical protein